MDTRWTKLEDLTNKKFNRLTVIELCKERSDNEIRKVFWKCRCDCGNIAVIRANFIKNGHTKSCGCYAREKRKETCKKLFSKPWGVSPKTNVWGQYNHRAKFKYKTNFTLTKEEFFDITQQPCYYCNEPPSNKTVSRCNPNNVFIYNGLDRIDSKLGYIKSNVVPCCITCNKAKNDMSQSDYLEWIKKTYACLQTKNKI
jgi:hypothetical protein